MNYDFSEAIAISNEEGWGISPGGLDVVFDLLEHLSDGNTAETFDRLDARGTQVLLALIWAEVRWSVLSREHG